MPEPSLKYCATRPVTAFNSSIVTLTSVPFAKVSKVYAYSAVCPAQSVLGSEIVVAVTVIGLVFSFPEASLAVATKLYAVSGVKPEITKEVVVSDAPVICAFPLVP